MQSNHITIVVLGLLLLGVSLAFLSESPTGIQTQSASFNLPTLLPPKDSQSKPQPHQAQPEIEVVFVLDTTGSMGGLIEGAKQKIWSIINELKQGQPQPTLKIGLVGYRDRGDIYVTRHSSLSEDIDAVYADLMAFQAGGGGDTPESVNQALHEAVTRMPWSEDSRTLRVVFLVGDAPPQSYQDDVPYTATCAVAREKDIIINTIQCGTMGQTTPVWKSIAQMGHGGFAAIRQDGGMIVTSTPYDEQIEVLNRKINHSVVYYGDTRMRSEARRKVDTANSLSGYANAERQAFVSSSEPAAAITGRGDLLADIENDRVKLEDLSADELPEDFRDLDKPELEKKLKKQTEERKVLQKELTTLLAKRDTFLKESRESADDVDAFDSQVKEMVRLQAATKNIKY